MVFRMKLRESSPAAFTLLELLVTLAIVSAVLAAVAGVFVRTVESKRKAEARLRKAVVVDAIFRRFAEDLRGVFVTESTRLYFQGDKDHLSFMTTVDTLVPYGEKNKAYTHVVLELGQNREFPRFSRLYRGEEQEAGALQSWRYQEIYPWISSLRFRYLRRKIVPTEETKGQMDILEKWDSREDQGLPDAIEVQLSLVFPPELTGVIMMEAMNSATAYLYSNTILIPAGGSITPHTPVPGLAVPVIQAQVPGEI